MAERWSVTWTTAGTLDVDAVDELEAKTIVDAFTLDQLIAISKIDEVRVVAVMHRPE
jgi:hypothetical protein